MSESSIRVLVTGTRYMTASQSSRVLPIVFKDFPERARIIVGDCPTGVDHWVSEYAATRGWLISRFVADWDAHGRSAGPKRNQRMVDSGPFDFAVAIFHHREPSRGTADCVRRAKKAGIEVREYSTGTGSLDD